MKLSTFEIGESLEEECDEGLVIDCGLLGGAPELLATPRVGEPNLGGLVDKEKVLVLVPGLFSVGKVASLVVDAVKAEQNRSEQDSHPEEAKPL